VDISMFVVRTPPGRAVELHVHPYAETFLLLEGRGRWTRGEEVVELEPEDMIVVPPDTPHGFRNIGDGRCSSSPCTSGAPCHRGGRARTPREPAGQARHGGP
jgi:quercetin dioxygenase-like cupin family protein